MLKTEEYCKVVEEDLSAAVDFSVKVQYVIEKSGT